MQQERTPFPQSINLIKEDGTTATSWNGKLHSWVGPALITPDGKKEYYLYGIQKTKDEWKEAKSQLTGLPWFKDPGMKMNVRF
jgi:hypothetical protein